MSRTNHMHKRMNQRAINDVMIDVAKTFGIENGDKIILNMKGVDAVLKEMRKWEKNIMRIKNRGGIVVVEKDNLEITTYGLERYKKH